MNSARIVVIDEDKNEAIPLLSTLGKLGLGSIYIPGDDPDTTPDEPISGIRLAFLDLKLIPASEPRDYVPYAVQVLCESVCFRPFTTGVVCWTKNIDDFEMVKQELKNRNVQPAFVEMIEDKLRICQDNDIAALSQVVDRLRNISDAQGMLHQFEENVHKAATAATDSIASLCNDEQEKLSVLAAIAKGASESKTESETQAMTALTTGLSSLLYDEIETANSVSCETLTGETLKTAFKSLRDSPLQSPQKSAINGALLFSKSTHIQPGAIFTKNGWANGEFPMPDAQKKLRSMIYEFFPQLRDRKDFINENSVNMQPCLLEITPSCDFAQGKNEFARFVGGLLIKSDGTADFENEWILPAASRAFATDVPFSNISNEEREVSGSYKMILNARILITYPAGSIPGSEPVCRLRHEVLSTIRNWLAAHSARPGYVAIY